MQVLKITRQYISEHKCKSKFYRINIMGSAWLARVRHDLVKRLLWPARDRLDVGGAPASGELVAALIDAEGRPVTAADLWAALRADAPVGLLPDAFEEALARALTAADAGDVAGVLALEPAFDALEALVRSLDGDDA
jgi:hypothetical protein